MVPYIISSIGRWMKLMFGLEMSETHVHVQVYKCIKPVANEGSQVCSAVTKGGLFYYTM